jgi:hypothetical protein
MYLSMDKRGIRHVEIILSFVIFVGAVGFALWFFNPGDYSRRVDSSLEYGFREITQNTSVNLEIYSVKINNNTLASTGFSGPIAINLANVEAGKKSFVRSFSGLVLDSQRRGTDFVDVDSGGWQNIDFIFVEFSEDFEQGSASAGTDNKSYYEIASHDSKNLISEKRFLELKKSYFEDYSGLREEFNIHSNFGFTLEFSNDSIVAEKQVPQGLEVFSEKRRVEVLRNESGRTEFADLVVKVW